MNLGLAFFNLTSDIIFDKELPYSENYETEMGYKERKELKPYFAYKSLIEANWARS